MDTDDKNPRMNKPNGLPANLLQNSTRVTPQEIMVEIARLEIHCPVFSPMTQESRREWIMTLCQDLGHKSLEELQYGARRYRTAIPPNKWFPTPGAWLEACKNPYDSKPRNYAPLDDLPPAMSQKDAEALVARISTKYKIGGESDVSLTKLKDEILERPPIKYVPMTPERRGELLSHLERATATKQCDDSEDRR